MTLAAPASAQHGNANILDAYKRAREIVDAAVTAHGGREALEAARQLRVQMSGFEVMRTQGLTADPPHDRIAISRDMHYDLRNGRLVAELWSGYPGGIKRGTLFITDSTTDYYVNLVAREYDPANYPPAATQSGNTFYLPQLILLSALQSPATLRSLGEVRLTSGTVVAAVAGSFSNTPFTLGFDPHSKQLRALLSIANDPLHGDAPSEIEFTGYRSLGGVLLPTMRTTRTAGELVSELTYTSAFPNYTAPDSLVKPPAAYTRAQAPPSLPPERKLAEGVWAVGDPGAASLVVAFRDYAVVVDAPSFAPADIVDRINRLTGNLPIRYVIPTHHHNDHAGGVKHYVARGATILTTAGNVKYMERIAQARSTLSQDIPAFTREQVRVETFSGSRTFSDGTRTLEIHDIGGPHAKEMLIAWLPQEGIVFQGDLIDTPSSGQVRPGTNNETTMHFGEWLKRRGWNVRVFGGSHGFLASPADFQAILAQPLGK
jgi:glyoxylase-like metal-dependent hydrolase (beta-lactamase superfamily II)